MYGRPPKRSLTPSQERAAAAFIEAAEQAPEGLPEGQEASEEQQIQRDRPDAAAPPSQGGRSGARPVSEGVASAEAGLASEEMRGDRTLSEPPEATRAGEEGAGDATSADVPSMGGLPRGGPDRTAPKQQTNERVFSRLVRTFPYHGGDVPAVLPWEEDRVRADVVKGYALRLPEPLYLKLKYVAEQTGQSINTLCREAIEGEVEERLRYLNALRDR